MFQQSDPENKKNPLNDFEKRLRNMENQLKHQSQLVESMNEKMQKKDEKIYDLELEIRNMAIKHQMQVTEKNKEIDELRRVGGNSDYKFSQKSRRDDTPDRTSSFKKSIRKREDSYGASMGNVDSWLEESDFSGSHSIAGDTKKWGGDTDRERESKKYVEEEDVIVEMEIEDQPSPSKNVDRMVGFGRIRPRKRSDDRIGQSLAKVDVERERSLGNNNPGMGGTKPVKSSRFMGCFDSDESGSRSQPKFRRPPRKKKGKSKGSVDIKLQEKIDEEKSSSQKSRPSPVKSDINNSPQSPKEATKVVNLNGKKIFKEDDSEFPALGQKWQTVRPKKSRKKPQLQKKDQTKTSKKEEVRVNKPKNEIKQAVNTKKKRDPRPQLTSKKVNAQPELTPKKPKKNGPGVNPLSSRTNQNQTKTAQEPSLNLGHKKESDEKRDQEEKKVYFTLDHNKRKRKKKKKKGGSDEYITKGGYRRKESGQRSEYAPKAKAPERTKNKARRGNKEPKQGKSGPKKNQVQQGGASRGGDGQNNNQQKGRRRRRRRNRKNKGNKAFNETQNLEGDHKYKSQRGHHQHSKRVIPDSNIEDEYTKFKDFTQSQTKDTKVSEPSQLSNNPPRKDSPDFGHVGTDKAHQSPQFHSRRTSKYSSLLDSCFPSRKHSNFEENENQLTSSRRQSGYLENKNQCCGISDISLSHSGDSPSQYDVEKQISLTSKKPDKRHGGRSGKSELGSNAGFKKKESGIAGALNYHEG